MPLVSQPNRGYADYQRVGNYDSGVLWNFNHLNSQLIFTSPVLDVSRFAYIAGFAAEGTSQHWATFTWYEDALAANQIGVRSFPLSVNINGEAQLHLPNLGSFLTVQTQPAGVVDYAPFYRLMATNRVHQLEFIPMSNSLITDAAVPIPANSTVQLYPVDYYAGPVQFDVVLTATGSIFLQALNSANQWFNSVILCNVANSEVVTIGVAPPGAWRLNLQNTSGAAATAFIKAEYSSTGAT